ncbi:MAG: hypothetical protein JWQ01_4836 [Massilia sp.]|nr:hypothetical protein [Massilia sp.]
MNQMTISELLDEIRLTNGLRSDAALAKALKTAAPVISKLRSGKLPLGAVLIIRIHLLTDIPVLDLVAIALAGSVEVRELAAA